MASTFKYSTDVASSQPRRPVPCVRLKAPRDESCEAAGLFLEATHHVEVIHALLEGLAHAEHHRRRGAHAEFVRCAVDANPVFGAALQARDAFAHIVVENLRATAGNRIEAGIPEPRDRSAQVELGVFGDCEHFGSGKAVQPNLREALLDAVKSRSTNRF